VIPDAGTCTRCPTEVRLKRNLDASSGAASGKKWSCTIKMRTEEDAAGKKLQGGSRQEELFKADITEDYELEMYIIAAQVKEI
jgi:hypothetical protein